MTELHLKPLFLHNFSALFYVFDNHVSGARMDSVLKPSEWIKFTLWCSRLTAKAKSHRNMKGVITKMGLYF